jgi:hypothetical protein
LFQIDYINHVFFPQIPNFFPTRVARQYSKTGRIILRHRQPGRYC